MPLISKLAGLFLLIFLIGQTVPAQDVTPEAVRQSIARGTQYLLKQQGPEGSWADYRDNRQATGVTSLATLALLNSGETAKNAKVGKSLDYLYKSSLPKATYAASLQVMVFCQADPVHYKVKITELARWLEATQIKNGKNKGGWHYGQHGGEGDNSNTQFAMLALHEAERAGVKIDEQTWRLAEQYWLSNQYRHGDGSWGYYGGGTGSMTCAGIASLLIALDHIGAADAAVMDGRIRCCGHEAEDKALAAVNRGLAWLGRVEGGLSRFSVRNNPSTEGNPGWTLYYLYALERVGRLTGRRFIGEGEHQHDWYREGAEWLIANQDKFSGFWKGTNSVENDPIIGTSLTLLFLSKGRRPVVISKLQHTKVSDDWDLHSRAIQNLTGRLEKPFKRELSWQTIDLTSRKVTVVDLLETPILFISGSQSLNLDEDQVKLLRDYVNQGGFIFAEACEGDGCSGAQFESDFRALMKKIFPESELRRLPPDHPVWFAEQPVNPKHLPADEDFWLWGLDACCRTSVVYCPRSLSCRWELSHPFRESSYPQSVKDEIEACARIGENVVAYATNRQLKEKLERPQVNLAENQATTPRGALSIPKLSHDGGADDAPNALANLLTVFDKQLEMKVDYKRKLMQPSDPKLLDHPLVFMHGRRAFTWSETERKAIKTYLDRGGFLFADSICASKEFADSLRAEMKSIYPDSQFVRLPAPHQVFTTEFHGFDVTTVTLRDPQLRDEGDPLTAKLVKTAPLLEGLDVGGRTVVVLSPYDISCALEKGASLECKGYIPPDAARLGANVILYALQQ